MNKIPSWWIRKIFYIIAGLKIGKGSRINAGTIIDTPRGVVIGDRSIINENVYIDGRGGLKIGNDVSISIYTRIVTASHEVNSSTFQYFNNPVEIEDNVWVGIGAIILDGSVIKRNVVIGAGCVFKGIAEENGIYIGNPAKKVSQRRLDKEYRLENLVVFR